MSTNNFCYVNRCVVVTDDDYESGNVPKLSKERAFDENRRYPSSVIEFEGTEKLGFTQIVLTAGYYAGSCIDFIQNEYKACLEVEDNYYYKHDKSIPEDVLKKLVETKLAKETKLANRIINKIKKEYGYTEVKRIACFSNGEALYKKVR